MQMPDRPSSQGNNAQQTSGPNAGADHRQRQAAFAAELRAKQKTHIDSSFENERPLSSYTFIMNHLEGRPNAQRPAPPVPALPPVPPMPAAPAPPIPPRNIARVNSTDRNSIQTPPPIQPVQSTHPMRSPPKPQVLDPVDRAIRMMVRELGFDEGDAKWALKITDTGEGIDVDSAVALLFRERISAGRNSSAPAGSLLTSVMNSQESKNSGWRWN